ncbi:thioredoxin-disulfide reductase [Candidatus Gottesmanbacteria bacterium]|nr:thioredoxin-disulfide reductase [Candidatus Gottesmanbacteria bacterium]
MYDVIIIGSGPAGYTAALYTSRAFLQTLVLTGIQPGGQLTTTTEVDNYPGFPAGINGTELVENMKKQAEKFRASVVSDSISNIKYQKSKIQSKAQKYHETFSVIGEKSIYEGRSVIIATGASAKYLGIPSEQAFMGKGVSACATCDGFFYRGKEVVVIGGGDTAMEEATFLTTFAPKVTIVHRSENLRASAVMLDRAKKNPKISFLLNKTVDEIVGDTKVTAIRLKDGKSGEVKELKTEGVFLAIGHTPSTGFLKGAVELDQKGYVKLYQKSKFKNQKFDEKNQSEKSMLEPQTETSVPGIFAAGDCVDPRYRQAIVAAGMGCMAALDAQHFLEDVGN